MIESDILSMDYFRDEIHELDALWHKNRPYTFHNATWKEIISGERGFTFQGGMNFASSPQFVMAGIFTYLFILLTLKAIFCKYSISFICQSFFRIG
jgi:hypothetical protein